MIKAVLDIAKRESGEKSPINFQVPIENKKELDRLCKKHKISLTGLMNGLIEVLIQESKGIYQEVSADTLLKLNNRMNEINQELSGFEYATGINGSNQRVPKVYFHNDPDGIAYYEELIDEKKRIETIFAVQERLNA